MLAATPPSRSWNPRSGAALVRVALTTMVIVASVLVVRICVAPLDVSGTTQIRVYAVAAQGNDEFAYWSHVGLAAALEAFHCSPTATALQWLKAAAHARSGPDVSRVARGLAAAKERSGGGEEWQRALCAFLRDGFASPWQALAIAQAGIRCPGVVEAPP